MKTRNECSFARKPVAVCGTQLYAVWDVCQDASYDIPVVEVSSHGSQAFYKRADPGIVALRTRAGSGRVYLEKHGMIEASANTLILFEFEVLQRYHTVGNRWELWWFEFSSIVPLHIPLHTLINVPETAEDGRDFQKVWKELRTEPLDRKCVATVTFLEMLYRWWSASEKAKPPSPATERVTQVIEEMYLKISGNWTVREMARSVGMCETGFRRAFHRTVGKSPKSFYNDIRMTMAVEMLRQGRHTVEEAAYSLGYCSASHFSKMFSRHFGVPPSSLSSGSRQVN
jgi:AraC-like DNA-binding protein